MPAQLQYLPDSAVKFGATVRIAVLAQHPLTRDAYPLLSQALLTESVSLRVRRLPVMTADLLKDADTHDGHARRVGTNDLPAKICHINKRAGKNTGIFSCLIFAG